VAKDGSSAEYQPVRFRLYVADDLPNSALALANFRLIAETYFAHRYELEIVDLQKNPGLDLGDGIVAIPTLIRVSPPGPPIIGNLSDIPRVLRTLGIADGTRGAPVDHPAPGPLPPGTGRGSPGQ